MSRSQRKTAVVVFPGRGSYAKPELGYLKRFHADKQAFLARIDDWRRGHDRMTVSAIDGATGYAPSKHASSLNASILTYACALADFADIDRERYEIVAVCGNSLGWYLTLAASGALDEAGAIRLIDTMGALMENTGVGGQILYPIVDAQWRASEARERALAEALHGAANDGAAYLSIRLGGLAVLAGDEAGLASLERRLPPADERYPFRLARHAAFHTPLLEHVSEAASKALPASLFGPPSIPAIDGAATIWTPLSTDIEALHHYTLGAQITETYDFSKSIEVALKEFAPDALILPGPGATLGPPVAQVMIRHRWRDIASKEAFQALQKRDPFVIAMGREDQRGFAAR